MARRKLGSHIVKNPLHHSDKRKNRLSLRRKHITKRTTHGHQRIPNQGRQQSPPKSYEHWEGLNDGGKVLWNGINTGLTFDFLGGVDGGFNFSKEKSKLINLNFIFENYNNERR